MPKRETDQPVDSTDDLSPVTVKVGEERDDDLEQDGADEGGQDQGGNEEPTNVPAAARAERPAPGMPARQGPPNGRMGSPNRPSKMGWKDMQKFPGQLQAFEARFSKLEGMLQAMQSMGQRPATPEAAQPAPHEQQLQSVTKQINALIQMSSDPNLSEAARAKMAEQFQELEGQRRQLERQALREELKNELSQELKQSLPDPEVNRAAMVISREFPEMEGNQRATSIAKAYYDDLVRENGGRESLALLREACAFACASLKLGRSRGPSRMGQAAFAGAGGMSGQAASDSDSNTFTFQRDDLQVMRNPYVSPQQVAEQMHRMRNGSR